jgi:hypothetical protein
MGILNMMQLILPTGLEMDLQTGMQIVTKPLKNIEEYIRQFIMRMMVLNRFQNLIVCLKVTVMVAHFGGNLRKEQVKFG